MSEMIKMDTNVRSEVDIKNPHREDLPPELFLCVNEKALGAFHP